MKLKDLPLLLAIKESSSSDRISRFTPMTSEDTRIWDHGSQFIVVEFPGTQASDTDQVLQDGALIRIIVAEIFDLA